MGSEELENARKILQAYLIDHPKYNGSLEERGEVIGYMINRVFSNPTIIEQVLNEINEPILEQ